MKAIKDFTPRKTLRTVKNDEVTVYYRPPKGTLLHMFQEADKTTSVDGDPLAQSRTILHMTAVSAALSIEAVEFEGEFYEMECSPAKRPDTFGVEEWLALRDAALAELGSGIAADLLDDGLVMAIVQRSTTTALEAIGAAKND